MNDVFDHIIGQIRDVAIRDLPFAHIVVPEIFPPDTYTEILDALPAPDEFTPAFYPGVGFGPGSRAERAASGLVYRQLDGLNPLGEIAGFLRGERFAEALLDKFSFPGGIPEDKRDLYADGNDDYTTVFDLHLERRGYEVPPHLDVPTKIITFQFYLVSDDELTEFGTLFCSPKTGGPAARSRVANAVGAPLNRVYERTRRRPHKLWHWLERSRLGTEVGVGATRNWRPWRKFDVVASAPALPNHFMAFAPNDRSYHAVRMNLPTDCPGRAVLRGFIRTGANTANFITG